MADRIFDPDTFTPSAQDFDGSWHTFGVRATLDEACNLVGGSAWFPNPAPANFLWIVYRISDESVIAEADLAALPGTTPGDWNDFTSADFDTPGDVELDPEEEYFVAYATNGDFTFRDSGVAFPYGNGIIHGPEAGFFNGGTGPTFPDSFTTAFVFAVDMLVETASGATHDADGTAAATGSATATATVDRAGAGTASGSGAATATSTVDRQASGTATGTAASSSAATVDRFAEGTASATGGQEGSGGIGSQGSGSGEGTGSSTATATVDRQAAGTAAATASATATATVDPGGVPPVPITWRAGRPEAKWFASRPESKWSIGQPEGG